MEIDNEMAVKKKFSCYKCGRTFSSQDEVVVHLKLIHNACITRDCKNISDMSLHSSICPFRGLHCVVCHKKFKDKNLLLTHFNQHIDVAFFICELCREGFQLRKTLQKHVLEAHGKSTFLPVIPARSKAVYQKCHHCNKYFKLLSEFEEHKSICNSPTITCDICKICFLTSQLLENHQRIEHSPGRGFEGHQALKDGKRYFCGMCYLGFFTGNVLRQHIKTHQDIANFKCDVCNSNFISEDNLQEHYLLHIEEHYVLHDVIQQHSCGCCKRLFKSQKQLENHLKLGICSRNKRENVSTRFQDGDISGIVSEYESYFNNSVVDHVENPLQMPQNSGESDACDQDIDVSDVPVYILKSGDELLNCDDGNCVVIIDHKSVFVLQRGACSSQDRMPDLTNIEAYQEDDNIDANLLKDHMLNVLFPPEENHPHNNEENPPSNYEENPPNNYEENPPSNYEENPPCNYEENPPSNYEGNPPCTYEENPPHNDDENPPNKNEENPPNNNGNNSNSGTFNENVPEEKMDTNELKTDKDETLDGSEPVNGTIDNDMLQEMYEAVLRGKSDTSEHDNYPLNVDNDEVPSKDKECSESSSSSSNAETSSNEHIFHPFNECNKSSLSNSFTETSINEPHICNICLQVFGSKVSLCLHMKGSHTGHDCYQCGLSFNSEDDLQQHESVSHKNSFKCNKCTTSFPKETQLKNHVCSIKGEKTFVCHYCEKSYAFKKDYDLHMMFHRGETPSKCEICGKEYASAGGYLRHKAIHHEGKVTPKNFVCNICDAAFVAFYPLKKHLENHMKKNNHNFECPKCKMYFTQKSLMKHLESHGMELKKMFLKNSF